MNIGIELRERDFNVTLTTPGGKEPFLTIKGCRIVKGQDGDFVSWPAKKLDSGKWFNYVYASRPFGEVVLREYTKAQAQQGRKADVPADDVPW